LLLLEEDRAIFRPQLGRRQRIRTLQREGEQAKREQHGVSSGFSEGIVRCEVSHRITVFLS
jgi:hypothetical protein